MNRLLIAPCLVVNPVFVVSTIITMTPAKYLESKLNGEIRNSALERFEVQRWLKLLSGFLVGIF